MKELVAAATLTFLIALLLPAHASQESDAAAAYDRAAAAYGAGDFARAAAEFTRADELVPSDAALEYALKAATRAGDAPFAMTLVERAEARGKALKAALEARKLHGRDAARVVLVCPPQTACEGSLDDVALEAGKARWVAVGAHKATLRANGESEDRALDLGPGTSTELVPSVARAVRIETPPPPPQPPQGPSPIWFVAGAGVTAALGAATLLSALDTQSKHDDFLGQRDDQKLSESGSSAQLRTNVLLAFTGVSAAAAAAIGLFIVDWRSKPIAITASASQIGLRGVFQ